VPATYVSSGTAATSATGAVAIPVPASPQARDLLVMQVEIKTTSTPTTTAPNFTSLGGGYSSGTHGQSQNLLYKWSDGTESGTVTATGVGGTIGSSHGRMSLFRGVGGYPGTPHMVGGVTFSGDTSTTMTHPAMAAIRPGSLAVVGHTSGVDEDGLFSLAGASGGTWTQRYQSRLTGGNDGNISLHTADLAYPATISGGSGTSTGLLRKTTASFILMPDDYYAPMQGRHQVPQLLAQ
jgi:hypothetical protein